MDVSDSQPYGDNGAVDWRQVRSAEFEVRQSLRYEYPGPITDLRHRLMLVPPDWFGAQRLLQFVVTSEPDARPRYSEDQFGNRLCDFALPMVTGVLVFSVGLRVHREMAGSVPLRTDDSSHWYTHDSPLTERSAPLDEIAAALAASAPNPLALAEAINGWVFTYLRYTPGATGVLSSALDALSSRMGVCQDYAHLMIALCRAAGLSARYVSGHLLGEGAMHAWVQVLLADPTLGGRPSWFDFDPTHGRRAVGPYVAVAAGRDYSDVSPTRGSFRAAYAGQITSGHAETNLVAVRTA